jgi:hypothetical protein
MKKYILSSSIAILMLLMLGAVIGLSTPEQAWARSDSVKGKWKNNAHIKIDGQSYFYGSGNDEDDDDQFYLLKSEGKKFEEPWDIDHEDNCVDYIKGDTFGPDYPQFNDPSTTTDNATLTIRDHKQGDDVCYEEEKKVDLNNPEKANNEFRQIDDKTLEPVHNDAFSKPADIDDFDLAGLDGRTSYQFSGTYTLDANRPEKKDGERYVNDKGDENCKSELIKEKKGATSVDATFRYVHDSTASKAVDIITLNPPTSPCKSKKFKDLQLASQDSEGSGGGGDDQDDSSAGHPGQPVDSGGDDGSGDDGSGDGSGGNEQSGQSGDGDGGGTGSGDGSGFVGNCTEQSSFLTFPTWYRGLQCEEGGSGAPVFSKMSDIWTVATNLLDILIQIGGLAAVGFIIYGGIRYILSQGEPEKLQGAKKIIANAIIGLILAITASTIVGFIAGSFS